MELHVNSWGNSLGVRLPKALGKLIGVENGSALDVSVKDGALVLKPVKSKRKQKPDKAFSQASQAALTEWNSKEDDDAFRDL